MREIDPLQFQIKPFQIIGQDWFLIAAEHNGRANAMTAGWGGLGTMWSLNAAFIFIRPQRFTLELVTASPTFSLNFFAPEHKKMLGYMGSVSGRDEDKIAKSGLTLAHSGDTPYFGEAKTVMVCRKLYAQPMLRECFVDPAPAEKWYPESDYHTMLVGEVVRLFEQ